jgi:y4mF family transcriptional regulator
MKENNNTLSSLSDFVKKKRKETGLTQKQLADKAGVGLRFVRELENEKPGLQMNKVNQVLILFGYELGAVPVHREKLINEKSKDLYA